MKSLYLSMAIGLLVLSACKEPSYHDKSLEEIHDLKKMGNEIENENDTLRPKIKKLIESDM